MKKNVRSDWLRLKDIVAAIDNAEEIGLHKKSSKTEIHVVAFYITIIGEAANRLSAVIKKKHDDIPWRSIIDMRNKIVHEYWGIDLSALLEVVGDDLPVLKKQIRAILREVKK